MRFLLATALIMLAPVPAAALTMDGAPDFVMRRVNGLIRGSIRSGSVSYSGADGLVLRRAELHSPNGRLVLSAKRIQVRVGLLALLSDVINIDRIDIDGLNVNMTQGANGEFDLLDALALRNPSKDDEPSEGGLRIKALAVNNSAVSLHMGGTRLRLQGLSATGDMEALGQFTANLRLRTGASHIVIGDGKGPATVDLEAAAIAVDHIGLGSHSISIGGGRLRIDAGHRLEFNGLLRPGAGRIALRAGGVIPDGWLKRILPANGAGLPDITGLNLQAKLSGAMGDPTIDVDARASRVVVAASVPRLDTARVAAKLQGKDLSISKLTAETLGGSAELSGRLYLGGDLNLDGDLRLNDVHLARLNDALQSLGGRFTGRALLKGPLALTDAKPLSVALRGRLTEVDLPSLGKQSPDLDLMVLQGASTRLLPSQAVFGDNTVTVDGSVYPEVSLNWRAKLRRARSLLAAFGREYIPPSIDARGQLRLSPKLRVTFSANTSPYTVAGRQLGAMALGGALDDRSLQLNRLSGTVDGAQLKGNLRVAFAQLTKPVGRLKLTSWPIPGAAGLASLDLASDPEGKWEGTVLASKLRAADMELGELELLLRYNGNRVELQAMDWDEGLGILSGAIGINTETMRTDGGLDLYLDATGLKLLAGDTIKGRVQVHVEPKGLITAPAAGIKIRFDELSVAGIPIRNGQIALAGTPEAVGGTINTSGNGTARATLRLSDNFERLALNLKLTAFRLDSLPVDLPGLEALADIDLRLAGPIGRPTGEANIRLRDLAVDDRLVGTGKGRITVTLGESMNAELDLLGWMKGTVEGSYPAFDALQAKLELDAGGLQWVIPGLAGSGTELDARATILAGLRDGEPDALVTLHALRVGNPGFWEEELENDGTIVLGYGGGRARIEQLRLKMGAGRAELRGWVEPNGANPRASIALTSGLPVELLQLVDSGFALTRGRFNIAARLRGTWGKDAKLEAQFEPEPGTALLHTAYPRQVNFTGGSIRLENDVVSVNDLHLEMGSGELNLAGTVNLDNYMPTELDLGLSANNLLLRFDNQYIELTSDVHAAGPIDSAKISGQINLLSGRIEQTFDITNFVFSSHTQGAGPSLEKQLGIFAATELDLEITSPAGVQVIAGLPLFSVHVRPTIDLRVIGQLADIGVQGVVEVEEGNGEILFPEAAFAIDNATVDLSQDPYYVSLNSIWEYVPRRGNDGEQDDVIPLRLGIEGPIDRLELRLNAPDYPDLTRPQLLGMLAQGQTPDLLIGQSLGEEGDSNYGDVALRMLTGQMFKRFERELERVFKVAFELPLDAAIDLGVDTLRMQGVVNLTERFLVAGEAEVVFGTEDNNAVDDGQNATATSNNRQSLSSTFVLTDAWRAEADLRSGYRADESGSLLELLLNLHWRLWYQ